MLDLDKLPKLERLARIRTACTASLDIIEHTQPERDKVEMDISWLRALLSRLDEMEPIR